MVSKKNKKRSKDEAASTSGNVPKEKSTPTELKAIAGTNMASKKNKKRSKGDAASTSGNVPRDESTPTELKAKGTNMALKKNKKRSKDAAAFSPGNAPRDNRTPAELKAKGKLAKKSSNTRSFKMKDRETAILSQFRNGEKKAKDGNQANNYGKKYRKSKHMNNGNKGNSYFQSGSREKVKAGRKLQNNNVKKDERKPDNMKSGNKENGCASEMSVDVEKDGKTEESLGGMIFMCNAKSKADCFSYKLMGVKAINKDIIMKIKPGLNLFLFDIDLKLLYGVYKASSVGGMKLVPEAFGGAFPAQIHFKIVKDCLPLPENVFKMAIKDNYNERTRKFKTELTVKQVEQLKRLFKPARWIPSTSKHSMSEPTIPVPAHGDERHYRRSTAGENHSPHAHERQQPAGHPIMPGEVDSQPRFLNEREYRSRPPYYRAGHPIMPGEVDSRPRFITEKEYASFGLQSANHWQPTAPVVVDRMLDHYGYEQRREQLPRNPAGVGSGETSAQKDTVYSEPFFPSEQEYRSYGLKSRSEIPATISPAVDKYNPYDESTTSLVNRYLSLSRMVDTPPVESFSSRGRESLASDCYSAIETRGRTGGFLTENERAYPPYAPQLPSYHDPRDESFASDRYSAIETGRYLTENERAAYPPYASQLPSDYGLRYHDPRDEPRYASTSASSHYYYGGLSASRR